MIEEKKRERLREMKQSNTRRRVSKNKGNGGNERYSEKKARRRRSKALRRLRVRSAGTLALILVAIALTLGVVMSSMTRTQLSSINSERTQALAELESKNISLKANQYSEMSLEEIEEYARNQLGLVPSDSSKEEYISVEKSDSVQVSEGTSGMEKLAAGFVRSFNAFLSYLR